MGKDIDTFPNKDMRITSRYQRSYSISLITREMQVKITGRS